MAEVINLFLRGSQPLPVSYRRATVCLTLYFEVLCEMLSHLLTKPSFIVVLVRAINGHTSFIP